MLAFVLAGLVLFGCVALPVAQAAEYFVCDCAPGSAADCESGDDGNTGVSEDSPWQSYAKARSEFAELAAGDAIRFCRGGVWAVTDTGDRWVNTQCRENNRCTIGAYVPTWGSLDAPKPWLARQNDLHGFAFQDGGTAEHEEGYVLEDLKITSNQGDVASRSGVFLQNDIDDVLLDRLEIEGFRIGVYVARSNTCGTDPTCDGLNERIVLRDSRIEGNRAFGWLGSSNGSQILDSYFSANGRLAVFDHNIYINGYDVFSEGMQIRGNTLYRSTLYESGRCEAVSLVVHGKHRDMLIEGNHVYEDVGKAAGGCWGIAVDPGYTESEAFTDITIRGNRVENVGNVGIGIASCAQCVIENNVVIQNQPATAFRSTAISAPNRMRGASDQAMDRVTIRNNSIYFGAQANGIGIRLNGEGDQHAVVSNAIQYDGSGDFDCFDADLPANSYRVFDHNLCHMPNTLLGEWVQNVGDLSDWQSSTGFGMQSISMAAGFLNPENGDLSPSSATSNLVNRGHVSESTPQDVLGVTRDGQPDIGAYEWVQAVSGDVFSDGFE